MTEPTTSAEPTKPAKVPLTARDKARRLGIGLFVAVCLAGIAYGASQVRSVDANGDVVVDGVDPDGVEISGDPELINEQPPGAANQGPSEAEIVEQTIPSESAEILQQNQIGVDLGTPYNATSLSINGTVIPEEELTRRTELNQVFFQPGEDATFEALPPGRVCATATIERVSDPGEVIRTVEWCFEVT